MRFLHVVVAVLVALASAAPCLAQSLDVVSGAAVKVEIARVDATVEEGVARVEIDETFRNSTDAVQEGVYRFKLPEDAVIGSFSMWMNGREKTGRVLEARAARRVYDSIVAKKKDPAILEQIGWREFKVSVFPIPARDTVRVKLVYAHVLRDDLGLETLEIPLPRGAGVVGDLRVHAKVTAARGLAGVDCPSHKDAKLVVDPNCAEATWSGDGVEPQGPFVLRAIPRREGFDVSVLADRPVGAEDGWFVARVVPRLEAPPRVARDIVFVIDRSGSMEGKKMDQARAALLRGLETLKAGDRFDVVSFSSDVTSLGAGTLLDATAENLAAARRAARDLTASGGTNIAGALTAALASRGADLTRFSAVVFLTDGDPTVGETNPDKILAAWRATCGATRLFAFGVGNDVHDFLLTKLASEGRGDARYVREDEDLEVKLGALFDRVRTPLLLDPSIEVEGDGVVVLDREPRRLPDLFQGRALVVAGRVKGAGKATIRLRGRSGAVEVKLDVPVEFPAATPDRPHVAQIWAKARVERLLDDMRALGANQETRAEILRLGLSHQLVTPYTSFLVVEDGVRIPDPGDSARLPGGAAPDDGATASVDRNKIPGDGDASNPNEVFIADAEPGEFNPDPSAPANVPSGATGGTSIGVGAVGHFGTGGYSSGGGRGGGGLGQGGGAGSGGATKQTETAVMSAPSWLKSHQSPDGRWSSSGFDAQCKADRCGGAGPVDGDLRATGLALLTFLGAGETHQSGSCRETVKNGLKWLRDVQDSDGCFGPRTSPRFLRDHAVAALAMSEAYGMTGSRVFKDPAQRGVAFALASRNSSGAWRLVDGALDVETTAWMALVLKSAALSGLDVDESALADAAAAVDKATDPATGRVAAGVGGPSSESNAAAALLVRILAGRSVADAALIAKGADLLVSAPIDPSGFHFASLAMFQIGGDRWKRWNERMKTALLAAQHMDRARDDFGSWDPPSGPDLGRVEATAFACLDLEVYYRYGRATSLVVEPLPSRPTPDGK
jgi:Ca-activated chloride channel family protein